MHLKIVRAVALWTTIFTGLLSCSCSMISQAIYWLGGWSSYPLLGESGPILMMQMLSILSLVGNTTHIISLLVFLALVQRDLTNTERWAEHARNFMTRDLISDLNPRPDSSTGQR